MNCFLSMFYHVSHTVKSFVKITNLKFWLSQTHFLTLSKQQKNRSNNQMFGFLTNKKYWSSINASERTNLFLQNR